MAPRFQESWTETSQEPELIWWERAMSLLRCFYVHAEIYQCNNLGADHVFLIYKCKWVERGGYRVRDQSDCYRAGDQHLRVLCASIDKQNLWSCCDSRLHVHATLSAERFIRPTDHPDWSSCLGDCVWVWVWIQEYARYFCPCMLKVQG